MLDDPLPGGPLGAGPGVCDAEFTAEEVTMAALLSPMKDEGASVGAAEAEPSEIDGNCSRSVSVTVALAEETVSLTTVVALEYPEGRGGRLPLRWQVRVVVELDALADDGTEADGSLAVADRSCRATIAGAAMDWVAARASTEKKAASIVDF